MISDARAEATASVGMAVALGALAMTFGTLLLAYAIVRAQAPSWPPPGEDAVPSPWPWPLMATVASVAGSVAMRAARTNAAGGNARRVRRALGAAALAGGLFVVVQGLGWRWLLGTGFRPSGGLVASVVYALTLFHALHALAALISLAPVLARAWRGDALLPSALASVSAFWHLVTIVWLVVFVAVFVA